MGESPSYPIVQPFAGLIRKCCNARSRRINVGLGWSTIVIFPKGRPARSVPALLPEDGSSQTSREREVRANPVRSGNCARMNVRSRRTCAPRDPPDVRIESPPAFEDLVRSEANAPGHFLLRECNEPVAGAHAEMLTPSGLSDFLQGETAASPPESTALAESDRMVRAIEQHRDVAGRT
jgi:hypothetical protein